MAKNERTGSAAGKAASKVLRDGRSGKSSKTAAGSALSQEKRIARPIGMEEGWRDGQLLYEAVSHHPTSGAWII